MQNPIGNEASIADREEAYRVLDNMKVLDLYNRVRRSPRSEPDAAGRERRIGANVAGMVRQLVFWENKGHAEDGWIWKSRSEWEDEAGLTYRMLRTARETAKAEGLLSFEERMHHDGRTRVFYRLDMLGVLRLLSGEDRLKRHGEDSNLHRHNPNDTDVTPPLTTCNPTPYNLSGVPLQLVTPPLTTCNPTVEYFSTARQESSSGDSALQAGKKQFSDENSKEVPTSLVIAAKEKEEKQEPYNTLGSEPHPFGDDGAWDLLATEGDEEPANSRSNGWNEDEDQAAVEEHNTLGSTDNHLGDHRELDRETTENMTEEQRQENKQRLSSLMENEAMTHNTLGSSINFLDDPDAWDRRSAEIESEEHTNGQMENQTMTHNTPGQALIPVGAHSESDCGDAVIESEVEVFEIARSLFGHAHEGEA